MSSLYSKIEPYETFRLQVSELHNIYVEQSGNPNGKPVIFLHGGPGGGIENIYRQYFNPDKWRIIMFDQRGCGHSTPHAELKENTTWDLINDIENIRKKLNINNWTIFGGSWGSTLALFSTVFSTTSTSIRGYEHSLRNAWRPGEPPTSTQSSDASIRSANGNSNRRIYSASCELSNSVSAASRRRNESIPRLVHACRKARHR